MTTSKLRCIAVFAVLAIASGSRVQAVERWADSRLKVTNNLVAWYDLSRQTAARGAHGLSPLQSWRDSADIVFDSAGFKRDLTQPVLESRPAYSVWASSSLHFDGTNDWLGAQTPGLRLQRATVFL